MSKRTDIGPAHPAFRTGRTRDGFGEREAEYVAIAEARLNSVQRGLGLPA